MGETEKKIIQLIREESTRIGYGKLYIEINVSNKKVTNVQSQHDIDLERFTVKRSENINH